MNWTIEFVDDPRHVRVTTSGTFTVEDHVRMVEDILSHPRWVTGMASLFDHRDLDFGTQTFEQMEAASRTHFANDARIGNGRTSVLMGPLADYGTGRQFQQLSDQLISSPLHVVLDLDSALAWVAGTPSQVPSTSQDRTKG